ncbi:MAG: RNA polymerase sigma factor [Bacillota bacterium]
MTDEELVQRCLHGDAGAFTLLVHRYRGPVYNLAAKMVQNPADAEDVAQETFLQVYRALPGFRREARFATWIYRIAANRALDCLRRRQNPARQTVPLDQDDDEAGRSLLARLPCRDPSPEDQVLRSESQARLKQALEALPDHYRVVLVLYHFQGLSYREIGEILDLPVRTVETRLYRAKHSLKEFLLQAEGGGAERALSGSRSAVASLPQ